MSKAGTYGFVSTERKEQLDRERLSRSALMRIEARRASKIYRQAELNLSAEEYDVFEDFRSNMIMYADTIRRAFIEVMLGIMHYEDDRYKTPEGKVDESKIPEDVISMADSIFNYLFEMPDKAFISDITEYLGTRVPGQSGVTSYVSGGLRRLLAREDPEVVQCGICCFDEELEQVRINTFGDIESNVCLYTQMFFCIPPAGIILERQKNYEKYRHNNVEDFDIPTMVNLLTGLAEYIIPPGMPKRLAALVLDREYIKESKRLKRSGSQGATPSHGKSRFPEFARLMIEDIEEKTELIRERVLIELGYIERKRIVSMMSFEEIEKEKKKEEMLARLGMSFFQMLRDWKQIPDKDAFIDSYAMSCENLDVRKLTAIQDRYSRPSFVDRLDGTDDED